MATSTPQDFGVEEGGAFEEVAVLVGSGDFVDPRFTATRPVAFLDALLGTRLCACGVVKNVRPSKMSSAAIAAQTSARTGALRNALRRTIVSNRISAGGNGTSDGRGQRKCHHKFNWTSARSVET